MAVRSNARGSHGPLPPRLRGGGAPRTPGRVVADVCFALLRADGAAAHRGLCPASGVVSQKPWPQMGEGRSWADGTAAERPPCSPSGILEEPISRRASRERTSSEVTSVITAEYSVGDGKGRGEGLGVRKRKPKGGRKREREREREREGPSGPGKGCGKTVPKKMRKRIPSSRSRSQNEHLFWSRMTTKATQRPVSVSSPTPCAMRAQRLNMSWRKGGGGCP